MGEIVLIHDNRIKRVLRALEKLAKEVPANAPDFQDMDISKAYCQLCYSYVDETISKAFSKAKQLLFFPTLPDLQRIFEGVIEEEKAEVFRISHEKAERAAECIFEIAMSGRYYSCFRDEKAKFCLSDIDFYWVELNFQSLDELFSHFQNEKFRQKNKKDMFDEIKSIFEKAQIDDDLRKRIADFSKTKKESYRIKTSGEKTDWLQGVLDHNDSFFACDKTKRLVNRVVKEVDELCKNFKSDFSYDFNGNIYRREENGFVFFKKVLQEVEVVKENIFKGDAPLEIVRKLCEKMKM